MLLIIERNISVFFTQPCILQVSHTIGKKIKVHSYALFTMVICWHLFDNLFDLYWAYITLHQLLSFHVSLFASLYFKFPLIANGFVAVEIDVVVVAGVVVEVGVVFSTCFYFFDLGMIDGQCLCSSYFVINIVLDQFD